MQAANPNMIDLQRAVAGDADALGRVLRSHHPRVLALIEKLMPADLRKHFEPLDVLQDVFFEACRRIGQFEPRGEDAFFAWIATIARNRLIDLLRRQRAAKRNVAWNPGDSAAVASLIDELAIYRRTPSRSAADHELLSAIERAIERLPPQYRKVVELRHVQGLDVGEAAERMSRSRRAVVCLYGRALDAMRSELQALSLFV